MAECGRRRCWCFLQQPCCEWPLPDTYQMLAALLMFFAAALLPYSKRNKAVCADSISCPHNQNRHLTGLHTMAQKDTISGHARAAVTMPNPSPGRADPPPHGAQPVRAQKSPLGLRPA